MEITYFLWIIFRIVFDIQKQYKIEIFILNDWDVTFKF